MSDPKGMNGWRGARLSLDDVPQPPLTTDTPFSTSTSCFPSPPQASSISSIEELLPIDFQDQSHHFDSPHHISPDDVTSDPILNKLAKGQGLLTGDKVRPISRDQPTAHRPAFKARPAPTNMMDKDAGPKMSKAAALRMGLAWDAKKIGGERKAVDFANTPGHKRNNLSLDIASLSSPSMAPRQNRTSQLRSGDLAPVHASPVRHSAEEVTAAIKAKSMEDKARRRQSMTLPASLSAPSITPRTNRASELRTGGGSKPPPTSFDRYLTSTTTNNVPLTPKRVTAPPKPKTPITTTFDDKPTPKEEKRRSIMGSIRSLAAPSITPRTNRTSLLRAPPPPPSASSNSISGLPSERSEMPRMSRPAPSSYRPATSGQSGSSHPTSVPLSRTSSISNSTRPAMEQVTASQAGTGSFTGPRPTRASLLRAGLGVKIQAGR